MKKIKLYSYILKHDFGFAPNPFHEICTLACCKPSIRNNIGKIFNKEKNEYDFWVVGISSAQHKEGKDKLIYAMKVNEVLTFNEYSKDKRFKKKIPKWKEYDAEMKQFELELRAGDNIYKYNGEGNIRDVESYQQCRSYHKNLKTDQSIKENSEYHKKRDLEQGGFYVLISKEYSYFGMKPIDLPKNLSGLYKKQGGKHIRQRFSFEKEVLVAFKEFVKNKKLGTHKKENNPSSFFNNEVVSMRKSLKTCA